MKNKLTEAHIGTTNRMFFENMETYEETFREPKGISVSLINQCNIIYLDIVKKVNKYSESEDTKEHRNELLKILSNDYKTSIAEGMLSHAIEVGDEILEEIERRHKVMNLQTPDIEKILNITLAIRKEEWLDSIKILNSDDEYVNIDFIPFIQYFNFPSKLEIYTEITRSKEYKTLERLARDLGMQLYEEVLSEDFQAVSRAKIQRLNPKNPYITDKRSKYDVDYTTEMSHMYDSNNTFSI